MDGPNTNPAAQIKKARGRNHREPLNDIGVVPLYYRAATEYVALNQYAL